MTKNKKLYWLYDKLLSDRTKEKGEKAILVIAIISFLIHLLLIYFVSFGVISADSGSKLLSNPIAAIYTPFSFILVYEVYLLIYYLPKSITTYIGKQYEIIALIIIRRLFKDLSGLQFSTDWFRNNDDLQFTYDLIASVLLFYLLFLFYAQSRKRYIKKQEDKSALLNIEKFILFKKVISVCLVPILVAVGIYSFLSWISGTFFPSNHTIVSFKNINNIFFDQFFTVLIIVDVVLLLLSFFHTDEFHKVIRNSGFIISTILIRLSFSVSGLTNTVLIVAAISFGLIILVIHNKYEKLSAVQSDKTDGG
jgi:hypothetical protein